MLRSRQLDRKPIDLHAVIRESLALVAHDIKARQVEVTLELAASGSPISGDPVLLEQVLVNLLVNGMDAMADMPNARRRIEIKTEVSPAQIFLSVSDTGTGLPAHFDAKLFAPFVTTKASGIGIGLTIARTIVEAHDGTLEAHNNLNGGATFVITLPRTVTPATLAGRAGAA
jgi:C4-dicarboxylate-specific signal transduction histidine kinase